MQKATIILCRMNINLIENNLAKHDNRISITWELQKCSKSMRLWALTIRS